MGATSTRGALPRDAGVVGGPVGNMVAGEVLLEGVERRHLAKKKEEERQREKERDQRLEDLKRWRGGGPMRSRARAAPFHALALLRAL